VITVHHLNNSRSQRVLWLLEELGVPYEIKRYQRDPKTSLAPPELLAVHPMGKSPVITEGDFTLAESGAILEYLVERHGKGTLAPAPGSPERLKYIYWMHFAEGTAMPFLVMKLVFNRIESAPMPFFARPIARSIAGRAKGGYVDPNIDRIAGHVDAALAKGEWFCGKEFTAADIQMSLACEALLKRARAANRPNIERFVERSHERPAYERALAKVGDFGILS
jgi:glutathione S-transferase